MSKSDYVISWVIYTVVVSSVSFFVAFLGLADGTDSGVGMAVISSIGAGVIYNAGVGVLSYLRLQSVGKQKYLSLLAIIGLWLVPFIMCLSGGGRKEESAPLYYSNQGTAGSDFKDDF